MRRDLHRQREWRLELERLRAGAAVGCLHVESRTLRSLLLPGTLAATEQVRLFVCRFGGGVQETSKRIDCLHVESRTLRSLLLPATLAATEQLRLLIGLVEVARRRVDWLPAHELLMQHTDPALLSGTRGKPKHLCRFGAIWQRWRARRAPPLWWRCMRAPRRWTRGRRLYLTLLPTRCLSVRHGALLMLPCCSVLQVDTCMG